MNIPNKFSQLSKNTFAIVTAGKETANIYVAQKEHVDLIDSLDFPKPRYSDKEGYFHKSTSRNGTPNMTGAVYETSNEEDERSKKLFRTIGTRLEKMTSLTHIYLFVPKHLHTLAKRELEHVKKNKKLTMFYGNYVHEPITTVLGYINQKHGPPPSLPPMRKEVRKMLNNDS